MDINVDELKQKLDNKEEFIFIDVREPHEYEEFNLGAKLCPLGDIAKLLSEYENQKDQEIVVHCRSGARSGMAKNFLMEAGFQNVRNLEGGILAWQEKY